MLGVDDDNQTTEPLGSFTQISAGAFHNCAIKIDGTLACWGLDNHGQAVSESGLFNSVSAGLNHTCGIMANGSFLCWGENAYGQLNINRSFLPIIIR